MSKSRTSEDLEALQVHWLMVAGGGIGIGVGSVLSAILLGFFHWHPTSVGEFCGLVGVVVWIGGSIVSVWCG